MDLDAVLGGVPLGITPVGEGGRRSGQREMLGCDGSSGAGMAF